MKKKNACMVLWGKLKEINLGVEKNIKTHLTS
jgi:hypothetical protein